MAGGKLFIGTSGFSYHHWKELFYVNVPQRLWLEHYAKAFATVELNVTFYRLPSAKTVAGWRERTPSNFTFAVKGSRFITHQKKLMDSEKPLRRFQDRMQLLGPKLGPVLWQLPPGLHRDLERLENYLILLQQRFPGEHVFEFRHNSWFDPAVYDLLRRYRATVCLSDMEGCALEDPKTPGCLYIRRHGSTGKYQGNYSNDQLTRDGQRIQTWLTQERDIYVYFNNDMEGHAVANGLQLKKLCR